MKNKFAKQVLDTTLDMRYNGRERSSDAQYIVRNTAHSLYVAETLSSMSEEIRWWYGQYDHTFDEQLPLWGDE